MDPLPVYPILAEVTEGLRRSLRKTIAWAVGGLLMHAPASLPQLALHLAACSGIQAGSALTRLYRLLHNPRFREEALTARLLQLLGRRLKHLLLAVDWTEWTRRRRCLVAAAAVARRALPVAVTVAPAVSPLPSQNRIEEAFLERLIASLRMCGLKAVLVFDRGFARPGLMQFLQEHAGSALGWVIRLPRCLGVVGRRGRHRFLWRAGLCGRARRSIWAGWSWARGRRCACGWWGFGRAGGTNRGGWPPTWAGRWSGWLPYMTDAWPSSRCSGTRKAGGLERG